MFIDAHIRIWPSLLINYSPFAVTTEVFATEFLASKAFNDVCSLALYRERSALSVFNFQVCATFSLSFWLLPFSLNLIQSESLQVCDTSFSSFHLSLFGVLILFCLLK